MLRVTAVLAAALLLLGASPSTTTAADPPPSAAPALTGATVIQSTKNDVSAPLASLKDKDQGKAIKDKKGVSR